MDGIYKIQLGSKEYVDAVNTDENLHISLSTDGREILPYSESSVINAAELFNTERQLTEKYRIYGTINFMSLVNGVKKTYTKISDFFVRPIVGMEASGLTRNLLNCFEVYLCAPAGNKFTGSTVLFSGNTKITSTEYQLKYVVLTKPKSFEVYKSGYGKNIYNDQNYSFHFTTEIDISTMRDSFNKPLTNLYLFFNFNPQRNGNNVLETVEQLNYNNTRSNRPYSRYNPGDVINGNWVYYLPSNFEEIVIKQAEHYVLFPSTGGLGSGLKFKYAPFVEVKLREFGDEVISGNISGTSQVDVIIPDYAVKVDNNGNYVWKDFLQKGYIDPLTEKGVNYPFINKRHYVFMNVVHSMMTDLNDSATANAFNEIRFSPNTTDYVKPVSDLDNIGKKC